jgi:hypothetical protein
MIENNECVQSSTTDKKTCCTIYCYGKKLNNVNNKTVLNKIAYYILLLKSKWLSVA